MPSAAEQVARAAAELCRLDAAAVAFLAELNFLCYAEAFRSNGFDNMVSISGMEREHMRDVGMLAGHAVKLEVAIAQFRARQHMPKVLAVGTLPSTSHQIGHAVQAAPALEAAPPPPAGSTLWPNVARYASLELRSASQQATEQHLLVPAATAAGAVVPTPAASDGERADSAADDSLPSGFSSPDGAGPRGLALPTGVHYATLTPQSTVGISMAQSPGTVSSWRTSSTAASSVRGSATQQRATMTGSHAGDVSLTAWLRQHNFYNVNGERKRFGRISYPLHQAVEENNPGMVQLLLLAGSNPKRPDSTGRTPLQLAERRNKRGSHDQVARLLSAPTRPKEGSPASVGSDRRAPEDTAADQAQEAAHEDTASAEPNEGSCNEEDEDK